MHNLQKLIESLAQIMLITSGWMGALNKNKAWKKCPFIILINSLSMLHVILAYIKFTHLLQPQCSNLQIILQSTDFKSLPTMGISS